MMHHHPLDPLRLAEIADSTSILQAARPDVSESTFRWCRVYLHEPPKSAVAAFDAGGVTPDRCAFISLMNRATGITHEARVNLTQRRVEVFNPLPGLQAAVTMEEFFLGEVAVRSSPEFKAALERRDIKNMDNVIIDPWSSGNFGVKEEEGRREVRCLCFLKNEVDDLPYVRPIEGVIPVVDLVKMEVVEVVDYGVIPVRSTPVSDPLDNYETKYIKRFRDDLKPLHIIQPEQPSFTVRGHQVLWQKWKFRVGFNAREGLTLHQIQYQDEDRTRPIIHRASLSEMVVPYNEAACNPPSHHYRKNAFDMGEYGLGVMTNSLQLGCDCLGHIHYFDAVTDVTAEGKAIVTEKVVCLHEEDAGILWKHTDMRTGTAETRRSRRLVVSFFCTLANYDYGFYWYLYQDGTIHAEARMTGCLNMAGVPEGHVPQSGVMVAPQLVAHIHQHFFCYRLDMTVDGDANTVYEQNTEALPQGPGNPHGNAAVIRMVELKTEEEGKRHGDPLHGRAWVVRNNHSLNRLGTPVGYKLIPGEPTVSFAQPGSSLRRRAGFLDYPLWVTPFHEDERHAAGEYPNQHPGGAGLPTWTAGNRHIADRDVVLWYTMGHHHIPRPEDYPVMPSASASFMLKPVGFFDANPALDVPPVCNPKSTNTQSKL